RIRPHRRPNQRPWPALWPVPASQPQNRPDHLSVIFFSMPVPGSLLRLLEKRCDFLFTFHAVGTPQADKFVDVSRLEEQIRHERTACAGPGTRRYTEYPKKCTYRTRHLI